MAILKKNLILAFGVLLVMTFSVIAFSIGTAEVAPVLSDTATAIGYNSYVEVYKNGELIESGHNVLYNSGMNMTRDLIQGLGGAVTNISLCNATEGCGAVTAAKAEAYNEITDCGLKSIGGDYRANDGIANGNWSIGTVFTATCDGLVVNVTRLENASGVDFAGRNISTVNLDTGDQLTVNWTIWVT